ncbi:MAG: ribosome silencing factor [Campylobacterales bacterium]|nr:ribosome silencing factor [Campylobacterales bacterium]
MTIKERELSINGRVEHIVSLLDSKKAEEIEVFDLSDADYIAQRVIIANSIGGKHTFALFDHLKSELKPKGEEFLSSDLSDDWIVTDLGDILIHIMTPQYRQRYSLEEFLAQVSKKES